MAKKQSTPSSGKIKARVLSDCALGKSNAVVELTAEEAAAYADVIDTSEGAVAYAESLLDAK